MNTAPIHAVRINNTRYQDNRRREYTQRRYQRNSYVPRSNYNEVMSTRTSIASPEHTAPAPQMAESDLRVQSARTYRASAADGKHPYRGGKMHGGSEKMNFRELDPASRRTESWRLCRMDLDLSVVKTSCRVKMTSMWRRPRSAVLI